ncbi:GNAT family N-acetyltransferase [Sphingobium sp. AS12]|uniref:GNAT family N-acetyltransferase n=1 Tax=Sphingobium sp. AS12 TaxID=2849495 RepID=UPI001C31A70F|nr:GNAT family N-acetyltransferase [Sphingobium sp. AS12]MBV2148419.1 GNAT family N-acetyltransferase [Sphingobium sp. AS12]
MMTAPVLHTDRLILRPHGLADYSACCALWGDEAVIRHIGGSPQDAQAVWFRLLRYAGMWSLLDYGMWVMEDRATGAVIGEAGLLSAARGLPELDGVPEAGWVLGPQAWGRGLATEAMAAVLGWANANLDGTAIRCIIEPDNGASIRVAEKLGFTELGDAVLGGKAIRVFDRPFLPGTGRGTGAAGGGG